MLRVSNLKLSIEDDPENLKQYIIKKMGIKQNELINYSIFKQSIDARKNDMIYFVYTVDVKLKNEEAFRKRNKSGHITCTPDLDYKYVESGPEKLKHRPVVVGTGPAGLFAGIILSEMGYRPVLLDRGQDVDARTEIVRKFWEQGQLDPECNVQFGEGGAGTFSDGKLTTLIRDRRCRKVLVELVRAGAPDEIMYSYKPHVGTDRLRTVVKMLRRKIISLGGEVRFNSKVSDIITRDGRVEGVLINGRDRLDTNVLILAPGHSARDTFEMLLARGVRMEPKPFSMGVRIEHPQILIDRAQYKNFAGHKRLGPADYKLVCHTSSGRSAYTFCMCPGGVVVAASSEEGCLVINGMSNYARDGQNANSALLVGVSPGDFGSDDPLAGMRFQRKWEQKAFALGGGRYRAPVQLVGDFLAGRASRALGEVKPSYTGEVVLADLKHCLPDFVIETLREAIPELDQKLRGFASPDAVLTGVETRSSSPIRILRDRNFECVLKGLYPAGEGAGYAGGIISAAVDGIRVAEAVAARFAPE